MRDVHRDFGKFFRNVLELSTAYYPQTDGHSERMIQTIEDMLRAYPLDFKER